MRQAIRLILAAGCALVGFLCNTPAYAQWSGPIYYGNMFTIDNAGTHYYQTTNCNPIPNSYSASGYEAWTLDATGNPAPLTGDAKIAGMIVVVFVWQGSGPPGYYANFTMPQGWTYSYFVLATPTITWHSKVTVSTQEGNTMNACSDGLGDPTVQDTGSPLMAYKSEGTRSNVETPSICTDPKSPYVGKYTVTSVIYGPSAGNANTMKTRRSKLRCI